MKQKYADSVKCILSQEGEGIRGVDRDRSCQNHVNHEKKTDFILPVIERKI